MTPCIKLLKQKKIKYKIHQYTHDNSFSSYSEEASKKLGISPEKIFKTLIIETETKEFAIAIIPASKKLDKKLMARALDTKKVNMAKFDNVEKITGYKPGGVSPIGQKKRLKTIIDSSSIDLLTIFISAGKIGLVVELNPYDLQDLTNAIFYKIC